MQDIAQIRKLIAEGKSDSEITASLGSNDAGQDDFAWDNPINTFSALARTFGRAVDEKRPAMATELVDMLKLFRLLWEEVVAAGDSERVRSACELELAHIEPGKSVAKAYEQLLDDAQLMVRPLSSLTLDERAERAQAEARYAKTVSGTRVTCLAEASAAVARAMCAVLNIVGMQGAYRALWTPSVLRPCAAMLLMDRPSWQTLLKDASPHK